jgi:uncharacterized Fe-S cluster-containing protein
VKVLTRQDLLKKQELKIERVVLGEDECVYVRQMTGRERDRFEQSLLKEKQNANGQLEFVRSLDDFRAKLAVNTICDADGKNLLNPGDIETLSQNMRAARLELIINKAQELNRISEVDKENMVKNSEAALSGDSTSGSVEN